VYENKQNKDNMPHEMSDIYVRTTRILQEISDLDGQFGPNDTLTKSFYPFWMPFAPRGGDICSYLSWPRRSTAPGQIPALRSFPSPDSRIPLQMHTGLHPVSCFLQSLDVGPRTSTRLAALRKGLEIPLTSRYNPNVEGEPGSRHIL
jgi:hypothetical protein